MTAKEYLEQIGKMKYRIESLKRLAERYEELSNAIPGQDFTRERVDHTPDLSAPFEKWIYKKIETEELIKAEENKLEMLKIEAGEKIDKLDNSDYRNILYLRYFNGMGFPEIASKVYVSVSTVKRMHRDALKIMEV